jgi:hypothetical protein
VLGGHRTFAQNLHWFSGGRLGFITAGLEEAKLMILCDPGTFVKLGPTAINKIKEPTMKPPVSSLQVLPWKALALSACWKNLDW